MQKGTAGVLSLAVGCLLVLTGSASAIQIYTDAAPNVFGSPNYPTWKAATYNAIYDGTFVNMLNGFNPDNIGTTDFEIEDEVVYSFGDLGSRLVWLYYIPNETIEGLQARTGDNRLQLSLFNTFDGDVWDFYGDPSNYGSTWIEPDYTDPNKIMNFNEGVIGLGGMAWWAASSYSEDTPEARAALAADLDCWRCDGETWDFTVKLDGAEFAIQSNMEGQECVPDGGTTAILLGMTLCGIAAMRRRFSV